VLAVSAQHMQRDAEGLQQIMMQSRVLEAVLDNVTTLLTTHRNSSPGQAKLSIAMPYIKSGSLVLIMPNALVLWA